MNTSTLTLGCIFMLWILAAAESQSCDAGKFVVSHGDKEYMSISSPTEVKMCGFDNICSKFSVAQNLTLDNNGKLAITGGNSVDLPDKSPTNELQRLSLDGGNLTISDGNKVDIAAAVLDSITTPWVPLQLVGGCTHSRYSQPMVKRMGGIVYFRGWLECNSALPNYSNIASLPQDPRFLPASWQKLVINRQDAGGNAIAFISVNVGDYRIILWNYSTTGPMGFMLDGVFYAAKE